jgi:hypothetical protein
MSMRVATISVFTLFAIGGVSGVSAASINTATSIVQAKTADSLVTDVVYEIQEGRCYAIGRKYSQPVDMSKCTARGRTPKR